MHLAIMMRSSSPNMHSGVRRSTRNNNSTPPSVCCCGERGRIPVAKVIADDSKVIAFATVIEDMVHTNTRISNDVDTTDIASPPDDKVADPDYHVSAEDHDEYDDEEEENEGGEEDIDSKQEDVRREKSEWLVKCCDGLDETGMRHKNVFMCF
jgi:hypothetical protein